MINNVMGLFRKACKFRVCVAQHFYISTCQKMYKSTLGQHGPKNFLPIPDRQFLVALNLPRIAWKMAIAGEDEDLKHEVN